jgi:hypothetical protein
VGYNRDVRDGQDVTRDWLAAGHGKAPDEEYENEEEQERYRQVAKDLMEEGD